MSMEIVTHLRQLQDWVLITQSGRGVPHSRIEIDDIDPEILERAANELDRLEASNNDLIAALDTIAGGHAIRFPSAPDIMASTIDSFRSGMWGWSQKVARAAIAKASDND